jgi:hypothetical protein
MATLVSIQNGNFTSSTTWDVVNATSFLDSVVTTATVTTTPTNSTTFIPGAIVVSGVIVQIADRIQSSPSGTFTVTLFNNTSGISVATVTVNVSDLPVTAGTFGARGLGWAHFQFASSVTLLAGVSYAVRLSTSVANQVSVYVASGTNWSRGFVTTTNAAPAATDTLIVCGNYTGAGTSNSYTVTMDSISSATVYGLVYVATKGTLAYGTNASTNYILRLGNSAFVTREGTLKMGDSVNPIPSDSTARLEISVTANNQFALFISGGSFITYGDVKSTGIKLASNAATGATSITLSSTPTNWNTGDTIAFPSTTTTFTQAEVKNLSAKVGSTTALIAALTNAHSGDSSVYTEADIANLTRNVVVTVGASTTLNTSVQITGYGAIVNCKYTQFLQCAGAATTNAGINVGTASGLARNLDVDIQYCSLYQTTTLASGLGLYLGTSVSNTGSTLTFSNNVAYGYGAAPITLLAVAGVTTLNWQNNNFMRCGPSTINYWIGNSSGNIFSCSSGIGVNLNTYSSSTAVCYPSGTNTIFQNWRIYANSGVGAQFGVSVTTLLNFTSTSNLTISGWVVFYNAGTTAILFSNYDMYHSSSQLTFTSANIFGTATSLVNFTGVPNRIIFKDSYFWRDRNVAVVNGVYSQSSVVPTYNEYFHFVDSFFAISPTGSPNPFTGSIFRSDYQRGGNLMIFNPQFSGTVNTRTTLNKGNPYMQGIQVIKENGVTGSNVIYTNSGNISNDTSIFRTSSPSVRLTPAAASSNLSSQTVRIPVLAGESCTVSVWVRGSAVSDGSAFNGSSIDLLYRFNSVSGNLQDTVAATLTTPTLGTWQQLSYTASAPTIDTVLEFCVECDGTTGWVNVDDWDTSSSNDTRGGVFFSNLVGIYTEPDFGAGESSYTFIN